MPDLLTTDPIIAERHKTHGDWGENSTAQARIRAAILSAAKDYDNGVMLSPEHSEALMAFVIKIGRIVAGDPFFDDHWRDIAKYAELARAACPRAIERRALAKTWGAEEIPAIKPVEPVSLKETSSVRDTILTEDGFSIDFNSLLVDLRAYKAFTVAAITCFLRKKYGEIVSTYGELIHEGLCDQFFVMDSPRLPKDGWKMYQLTSRPRHTDFKGRLYIRYGRDGKPHCDFSEIAAYDN